ncbi:MAG: hypothetical protein WD029_03265 [Microthrixaceae bacterium]
MRRFLISCVASAGLALGGFACTSSAPGGGGGSAPLGLPSADIWIAGDSIAQSVHYFLQTPGVFNAARGGNGYVKQLEGTIPIYVTERLALPAALDGPKYLIAQGTITDYRLDFLEVTAAMATFEADLNARGIVVIWLTSPIGTYPAMPEWLAKTNGWMMQRPHVMDCNTADVRYAGFPDLIHPTRDGYLAYAACVDTKLAQTIAAIENS